jgi:hypothetical protein
LTVFHFKYPHKNDKVKIDAQKNTNPATTHRSGI